MSESPPLDAALLLYHHFPGENAPTIKEHVDSFSRHSRFPVFTVNTDRGFPRALSKLRYKVVVLHYSLFGGSVYYFSPRYERYLEECRDSSYVIAFFQDEYRYCKKRFDFLNRFDVDAVYTLLEPEYHQMVYGKHTSVRTIQSTLTGYVSDKLTDLALHLTVPDEQRSVDVGYRARRLPFWMGRGAQEKYEIADRFVHHAEPLGLRLDIDASEGGRIYGDAWFQFVASCRGMLGVEAGTSIFDLDDSVRVSTEALLEQQPDATFEELEQQILHEYEDKVPYRTVSPRHFEAAALRVAQILYPGRYSGVMEPDVHYFALEKDFSNFDDVMRRFLDVEERRKITERAYDDLIASGAWSYQSFVKSLDDHFVTVGIRSASMPQSQQRALRSGLRRGAKLGQVLAHPRWFLRNLPYVRRRATELASEWVRRKLGKR